MACNKFEKTNQLYSERVFYTNDECFTQLVDKCDNYLNIFDVLFRGDTNRRVQDYVHFFLLLRKYAHYSDDDIKWLGDVICKLVT
jgi:hypothetical protein